MKKSHIFFLMMLLKSLSIFPQIVEVVSGLDTPGDLVINGNDLYISEYFGNKISKIDVTQPNPVTMDYITGLDRPVAMVLDGNFLYIAQHSFPSYTILKVDIESPNPSAVEVISFNDFFPTSMVVIGNDLYINLGNSDTNNYKVSKLDLTQMDPIFEDIIVGLNDSTIIDLKGNDLYITERGNSKIIKFDITSPNITIMDVISGIPEVSSIHIDQDILYACDNIQVFWIDIASNNPTATEIEDDLVVPRGMITVGNDLYIAEFGTGKVLKIGTSTLSVVDFQPDENTVFIYPSLAEDFLQLRSLNDSIEVPYEYIIYDVLGNEVKRGNTTMNQIIPIQDFASGLYFLTLKSGLSYKFIKR